MTLPKPLALLAVAVGSITVAATPRISAAELALEEIIVTANKRAESANDVGLSVTALDGNMLADQKLTSLEDISTSVPGLVYSSSTANTPIFTLRGIGFNEQSLGAYPATSLYIDEAPLPFPVLASHTAYDLERVEVLKGPQGILFGQNSTGGAINFISAKPGDEFEAGGDVSYGNYSRAELNGYISGPLTQSLSARFSFTGLNSDGWQRSNTRNDSNGAQDYLAGRIILNYEPTDNAAYLLNINGWQDDSEPQAQQFSAYNPAIRTDAVTGLPPGPLAVANQQAFSPEDPRAADWSAEKSPSSEREFYQIVGRGDWFLTPSLTLTALSTYVDFEQEQSTDGDGLPLELFDLSPSDGAIDSWISEIRLSGSTDNTQWIIGANYEHSNTHEDQILNYVDSTNYTAQNAFINSSGISLDQEIDTYAVFGNIDFDITDQITLKAGTRYTDSNIEVNSCNFSATNRAGSIDAGDGSNVATLFNVLGGLFGTVNFNPITVGDCYTLNNNQVPGDPYVNQLDEDNTSWRIGADYRITDDHLLYLNVSQGYKSGSFPTLAAANFFQLDPVTQESVKAYELGVKSSLLNQSLQLNTAAFYYDYEDKQLRTKVLDPVFGFLDVLENVPKSKVYGIESEITAQVTQGLRITAAITWLESEVKQYQGASFTSQAVVDNGQLVLAGGEENFSGDPIPFTPDLTYMLDAQYSHYLNGGGELFAGVNMNGQSSSEASFGAGRLRYSDEQLATGARSIDPYFNEMDGYTTWNTRLGYISTDERFRITLWGKNIFDEHYVTNVISSSDSTARFAGATRTYGITFGFNL
ncbi:TonB-dependent receptor [Halioxenophilus aromaticivorans]|uniref:TonB-dependent receptor n=1 Tax=Halioxenophilus aromaticivorans TaxID=1306992 RepID=A0AAV3U4L1_9ALTE